MNANTAATPASTEATTTIAAAPAAPKATKAPSKKSGALAIFQAKLAERTQGLFGSNKEFRAAVLAEIQAKLGVSVPSAATMYNAAKKEAEAADATVGLGRDPKKVKAPSTGKRGRPAGSKNKEVAAPAATDAAPAAEVAAAPAAAPAAEVAEATA